MNLYAQYIKEREGYETIVVDHGFATFKKVDDDSVYLRDIYVEKEHRKNGVATKLSELVALEARNMGASKIIGSVCTDTNGVDISIKTIMSDGFKFSHISGNMIYFKKLIE